MRNSLCFGAIASVFVLFPGQTIAEFKALSPPNELRVEEEINEGTGTFAGSHTMRIRAGAFIASLQLIGDEPPPGFEIGKVKLAPIIVPDALTTDVNLCLFLQTIDGAYAASSEGRIDADRGVDAARAAIAEFTYDPKIRTAYDPEFILSRAFVAEICSARQSSYYLPLIHDNAFAQLRLTLEISGATVRPSLTPFGSDGQIKNDEGARMEATSCVKSRRIRDGYDCFINVPAPGTEETDARVSPVGLYELEVLIGRPGNRPVQTFKARVSIPGS